MLLDYACYQYALDDASLLHNLIPRSNLENFPYVKAPLWLLGT